jgi:TRAP-type C4-dicarboxylate transport system permease small subunit
VYNWRNAVLLGVAFIVTGVIYFLVQGDGEWMDRAGVTMLIATGIAMAITFVVLLRGSGEL